MPAVKFSQSRLKKNFDSLFGLSNQNDDGSRSVQGPVRGVGGVEFRRVKKKMEGELELSPLRSLDDFLLESARFQIPNVRDLDKWAKRVVHNLLYYQTNYFFAACVIFLLFGILHPVKMLCGMMALTVAFGLFFYVTNTQRSATQFKKDHPVISILLILIGGYFIVYMLGSVLVFIFGILLPFVVIFVHASMRLRNIKNKLVNKMEEIGLKKKTPMGILLEALGLETEIIP